MKHIFYAAMLLLGLGIVVGCSKDPDPQTLSVTPTLLTFESIGGTQSISITTNASWAISSSQSWCKVSQLIGNATGSFAVNITVTCDKNTTYDDRTCTLTIGSGRTSSQTVEVKQDEK